MVIGIITPDGRRAVSHGSTSLRDGRPVDSDTAFEIASVTKVFTCLLLTEMVARREVALGDPVAAHLPTRVHVPHARGGRSHWWTWPPTHPVSRRCRRVFRGLTIRSHRPTHSNSSGLYCVLPPICASKPSGSWTWKLPSVARIFNPRRFSSASTVGLTVLSVSQLASVYAM